MDECTICSVQMTIQSTNYHLCTWSWWCGYCHVENLLLLQTGQRFFDPIPWDVVVLRIRHPPGHQVLIFGNLNWVNINTLTLTNFSNSFFGTVSLRLRHAFTFNICSNNNHLIRPWKAGGPMRGIRVQVVRSIEGVVKNWPPKYHHRKHPANIWWYLDHKNNWCS